MKRLSLFLMLFLRLTSVMGGEEVVFELPETFYAHQRYENSSGMNFEAKVHRLNELVRIELMTEAARGAYTILDVSQKLVHLVYPDKQQFLTLPYFGPSKNKEFVDETVLYFQKRMSLIPVLEGVSNNTYQLFVNGESYQIVLKDNGLPETMTRKDEGGSSSVTWIDIVIQDVNPNLFRVPEGYNPIRSEDE